MDENREEIETGIVPGGDSSEGERPLDLAEYPQDLGKGRRHLWKYIVILLVVLGVIIAGGIYLKGYIERSDPQHYIKHQRMGMEYFRQGLHDLAVEEFLKALKARPESFDSNYGLALAYLKKRNMEEAVKYFEKALTISPDRLDVQYSLGVAYQRMKRFERALEVYHKIAKKEPGSYQVFSNVGIVQMELGDHAKAIMALEHSIKLKPDYFPAYFNLAKVYLVQGKVDLAVKQYEFIRENASKKPETKAFVQAAEQRLSELKPSKDKGK